MVRALPAKSGAKVAAPRRLRPRELRAPAPAANRASSAWAMAPTKSTRASPCARCHCWKELFAEAGRPELFQQNRRPLDRSRKISIRDAIPSRRWPTPRRRLRTTDRPRLRRRYPQISFDDDAWGIFEPRQRRADGAPRCPRRGRSGRQQIGVDYRDRRRSRANRSGQRQLRTDRPATEKKSPPALSSSPAARGSRKFFQTSSAIASSSRARKFFSSACPRAKLVSPQPSHAHLALSERRILRNARPRISRVQSRQRPPRRAADPDTQSRVASTRSSRRSTRNS